MFQKQRKILLGNHMLVVFVKVMPSKQKQRIIA